MVQQEPIRFTVVPRDVPAKKVARRMHLTEKEFLKKLPQLIARGFPKADPTTGMFDLVKIDRWMDTRDDGDRAIPEHQRDFSHLIGLDASEYQRRKNEKKARNDGA
jgi:hypothetical protein